jgi:hypothetical protein
LVVLLAAGCGARTPLGNGDAARPEPSDAGRDAGIPDSGPPDAEPDGGPPVQRPCRVPAPVDFLLVVDDSGSMSEEQQTLSRELPRLVSDLADPPDANDDGRPDWRPIRNMHLGVVTTEGTGDFRTRARDPNCEQEYPRFLQFRAGEDDTDRVSMDYGCMALAGTSGSVVEEPLESAIRALLPADAPFDFPGGRIPGDGRQGEFLRDDSMLAVLVMTDEDDCSHPGRLGGGSGELPPCLRDSAPLYPLDRYERAFRYLRPDRPDLFSFGVIAGIPVLQAGQGAVPFQEVLERRDMQYQPGGVSGLIEPACDSRRGEAIPARRLVRLASRFESQAVAGQICQGSYQRIVGAMARLVGLRACEEFE